jgi:hypothetical protein
MPWFDMGVNGSLRNSQGRNPDFMGFHLHPVSRARIESMPSARRLGT